MEDESNNEQEDERINDDELIEDIEADNFSPFSAPEDVFDNPQAIDHPSADSNVQFEEVYDEGWGSATGISKSYVGGGNYINYKF